MAISVTLNTITSGYNLSKINANFTAISAALQNALSRTGTSPNTMSADIDMNNNDLINVKSINADSITIGGSTINMSVAAAAAISTQVRNDANAAAASAVLAASFVPANYYTKTQSDSNYYAKAVVYTKTEADTLLSAKAPQASTYTKTEVDGLVSSSLPVGTVIYIAGRTAPTGFIKGNAAAVSRTTYAALFNAITLTSTVTITIATPGVVTWTSHGLVANDPIRFTTTGGLPTGLLTGTTYYVVGASITTNTFQLSATPSGAAINTTGSQSGVHTALFAPYGYGDGSTTFNVPELRAEFPRGWDDGRGVDTSRGLGSYQSSQNLAHTHTGSTNTTGAHTHNVTLLANSGGASVSAYSTGNVASAGVVTDSQGAHSHTLTINSDGGTEARPRNVALLGCIKY